MSHHQPAPQTNENRHKYLVLQVHFLLKRYHGKEWPPSPRRLFLAFVSTLYKTSKERIEVNEGEKALLFFERQKPPTIYASKHTGCSYTISVPNNDLDKISKSYARGKEFTSDINTLKTTKKMTPHITDTIQYSWEIDPKNDQKNVEVLCNLAKEIPVLGLGIDPVTIHGIMTDRLPVMENVYQYTPDENVGDTPIDVPDYGLLDDAKRHYKEFLNRLANGNYIKPVPITKYRNQRYKVNNFITKMTVFMIINTDAKKTRLFIPDQDISDIIKHLEKIKSEYYDIDNSYIVAKVVALPSIGRYADLRVRRIGLIIPPNVPQEIEKTICNRFNAKIIKTKNNTYSLKMLSAKHSDKVQKLYNKQSASWRSVTPLELGIQDNSSYENITKRVLDALKVENVHEPVKFINFRRDPYWKNLPKASKTQIYAEIEFESKVSGPFMIGRNQNAGQGLFAPSTILNIGYFEIQGERPHIEETVLVADIMKQSIMSKIKKINKRSIPSYISGHDLYGNPLQKNHTQAFWLPMDSDQDGFIDHIAIYVKNGFDTLTQNVFYKITRLSNNNDLNINILFRGFYTREDIEKKYLLFSKQKEWNTVTPYFMPWHAKKKYGVEAQIKDEIKKRYGHNNIPRVHEHDIFTNVSGVPIRKFQSRRNGKKPINVGKSVRLSFKKPIRGPISLGFGAHFGLGMFAPVTKNANV